MIFSVPTPVDWVASNSRQLAAWGGAIYGLYRVVRATFTLSNAASSVKDRAVKSESTIHLLATNHLPHLQVELETLNRSTSRTNELLESLREDNQAIISALLTRGHA